MSLIRENIKQIKSGLGSGMTVVAVTKNRSAEEINEAISAGITDIAENRVQELLEKYADINKEGIKIHFIGHLQTNKVKYIIDKVDMIQSLDSVKLAAQIDRECAAADKSMDVLVQVNIGNDPNKYGIAADSVDRFLKEISLFRRVNVRGLMSILPAGLENGEIKGLFRDMRKLFVDTKDKKYDNVDMSFLSMGMSADYRIAADEGSNMVRIGTAMFGARK